MTTRPDAPMADLDELRVTQEMARKVIDDLWARNPQTSVIDPDALDRWRDHACHGDGHDRASVNKNTLFRLVGTIDKLAALAASAYLSGEQAGLSKAAEICDDVAANSYGHGPVRRAAIRIRETAEELKHAQGR